MRGWFAAAGVAVCMLACAVPASAQIPDSLKAGCQPRTPVPGYSFELCTDGNTPVFGRTANVGGVSGVRVPAKYDGFDALPPQSADAATVPGADPEGKIALDVDISKPTIPAPPGGYPMIVFMHGCCAGDKFSWQASDFGTGERWHFNNAWFASRGYVVVNYTSRGFRNGTGGGGSTGETHLASRRYEINDFQHLAGLIADDSSFNVNPKKIVPTGGSYGGGFAWLALTDPKWRSPGGRSIQLAVTAPRYGWTDLVYSLIPTGHHSQYPDRLPAFDGSDTTTPFGIPKQSINNLLFLTAQAGATFTPQINEGFACLQAPEPFETQPACQDDIASTLPEFINDRSAYYQNQWFSRIGRDSGHWWDWFGHKSRSDYRIPIFNAGTLTDPLFTPVEALRMTNRIQRQIPKYPVQQYYGDYQHFVQNKAKEWGDLCGADHHVCTIADYPGGNVNATPANLYRTGVTSRLNDFVDHYAKPPGNASEPKPKSDVTAALQICPQNASAEFPADEPGPTFTAATFHQLAPYRLRFDLTGTQTTVNNAEPNPHAANADPAGNLFTNGGRCPFTTTPAGPGVAVYDTPALTERATMIGATKLTVDYQASTATGVQLNARLYDLFPNGTQVLVDRGPYRVERASGPATYELHGNGWRFEPGHKLRLELAQDDGPFLKPSEVASTITIDRVKLRIPVREPQPPRREDFKSPWSFCKAERDFLGDAAFNAKYQSSHWAWAFVRCVWQDL